MSTIKPTVGRKVWYYGTVGEGEKRDRTQPFDATVLYVHPEPDAPVNLHVIDHNGYGFPAFRVSLHEPNREDSPDYHGREPFGYATWMPYQVGQAKKEAA